MTPEQLDELERLRGSGVRLVSTTRSASSVNLPQTITVLLFWLAAFIIYKTEPK